MHPNSPNLSDFPYPPLNPTVPPTKENLKKIKPKQSKQTKQNQEQQQSQTNQTKKNSLFVSPSFLPFQCLFISPGGTGLLGVSQGYSFVQSALLASVYCIE